MRRLYNSAWPVAKWAGRWWRRVVVPRSRFVAVVGSFGKTTTGRTVRAALGRPPLVRRMPTKFTGVADKIVTTRPNQRYAVAEVGIDGFDQMAQQAWALQPDVAVVTCIGSEHHRTFGTLEATRAEKAEMLKALPPNGAAVLNGDDPNAMWMAGRTRARIITYGMGPHNDVRATDVALDWPRGMRFRVHFGRTQRPACCRLIGEHMVYTVLAALAVGLNEGLDPDCVLARVASVPPTVGRMQPVPLANGAIVLRDDYKSAQETVEASLAVLANIPARRRFVVLGEITEPVGSLGPLYRRIGALLAGVAERAILFGPNARKYRPGAKGAGMDPEAITSVRREMGQVIELLRSELGPGDVVLVKGRHDQRLERITLALTGRDVRCWIRRCALRGLQCDSCPALSVDAGA
jgi:UDP-N-acetylmuramoyl-tripeptide--D-alanyl-D-alanine ligase